MSFRPLSTANSLETNIGQINDMIRDLNAKERIEIFNDDTGTRRVLLGKGANGFYGLKVSKEGQDVYSAADNQLIFNSDQNVFKIANIVTGSIAINFSSRAASGSDGTFSGTSTNTLVMPHNLGYVPAMNAYYYDPNSGVYTPTANGALLGGPAWSSPIDAVFQGTTTGSMALSTLLISADSTNITIQGLRYGWARSGVTVPSSVTPTITFKIYCLQETAS